ncbi:MAG: hypothetical protein OXH15_16410 [Gammaproteobacteria bacterium]|nr:hypothetical protein [Gammaproteobacteria bacterium]
MNDNRKRSMLPEWLDARTLTLLAAFIALGALIQTAFSDIRQDIRAIRSEIGTMRGEIGTMRGEMEALRAEIHSLRVELRADIGKLDDRLRVVETDVAAVRAGMVGFDARIRAVEQHARHATQRSGADTPER